MSFAFTFTPTGAGMSAAQYDECIKRLKEAGAGNPEGRLYHVCYGDTKNLMVMDVWDSVENFEKFGQILMPILNEIGVNPGEPAAHLVHNAIEAHAYA